MKFQIKHPNANSIDHFEFYVDNMVSYVTKMPSLGSCRRCQALTRWMDVLFQVPVCSEECGKIMWEQYRADKGFAPTNTKFEDFSSHVKDELKIASRCDPIISKDILIVVHNQLPYFRECVESIMAHTKNFHLYIWDNASCPDVTQYLNTLEDVVHVFRSEQNIGFIVPNNELVAKGTSEYIILINSDCKVFPLWDRALIGYLQEHSEVSQVGFWGGHLDESGMGGGGTNGSEVDYIPGWGFCLSRATYQRYGLFDPTLTFAYGEDADLSLRLKQAGHQLYALYAPLLCHYQNKTIIEVANAGEIDVAASFEHNHAIVRERWRDYLTTQRVLLQKIS